MSAGLDEAVAAAAAGGRPDGIALMRILGEAETESQARLALGTALAAAGPDTAAGLRLQVIERLWREHPGAWGVVRDTLAAAAHDRPPAAAPEDSLRYWSDAFDRVAAVSPEGSVALYSLGSPALLAAATDEVVAVMDGQGLLGPAVDVLDLGCGIGRFLLALAPPRCGSIIGLDLSPRMVAEARSRTAGLAGVRVERGSGRDLAGIGDASLDLILAADVFPYLVMAGPDLVADHLAEFARVLRPGGRALILNYSYRGDRDRDRDELDARARAAALDLARYGPGDFATWDAPSFLLRRRP